MRKPALPAPRGEERAVQRREQPGLHFRRLAQLVALRRPHIKRLLGEVLSVGFAACEAQRKAVQRLVMFSDDGFKGTGRVHNSLAPSQFKNQTSTRCTSGEAARWDEGANRGGVLAAAEITDL